MPDKIELGKRIKKVREDKHLTLKNIEASAGISATHISEIERGKTSPTLGALIRIATALGKDPSYFIEEEDLGDTSIVTLENRIRETLDDATGTLERLTSSIPGGQVQACAITLQPGNRSAWRPPTHDGNEAIIVLSGQLGVSYGGEQYTLDPGDSACLLANEPRGYANPSHDEVASFVWVCSRRGIA